MSRRRRCAAARDRSMPGGAGQVAAEGGGRPRREGTPKQSKEPGATAYVHATPPFSSSWRRLHLRPAVSTVASLLLHHFLFLAMPVSMPSSRRAPVRCCFPMNGRRPVPLLWRHRTVATPGCYAGRPCERVLVLHLELVNQGPPTLRRRAMCCAHAVPQGFVNRPSFRGVFMQGRG
jgi:hypothetical protein